MGSHSTHITLICMIILCLYACIVPIVVANRPIILLFILEEAEATMFKDWDPVIPCLAHPTTVKYCSCVIPSPVGTNLFSESWQ